jgi:hypothetical protein
LLPEKRSKEISYHLSTSPYHLSPTDLFRLFPPLQPIFITSPDQGIEAGALLVLKQLIHGGRGVHVEQLCCLRKIQDAFFGFDAEPLLSMDAHGQ